MTNSSAPTNDDLPGQDPEAKRRFRLIAGILIIFNLAGCLFLASKAAVLRPSFAALFYNPTATLPCSQPVLILGGKQFPIASLKPSGDGTLQVPQDSIDKAYWIENPKPGFLFTLNPSDANLNLGAKLKQGDVLLVIWADCGVENYTVQDVQVGSFDTAGLLANPPGGASVFLLADPSSKDVLIHADRQTTSAGVTPNPTESAGPQFDLTFQETGLTPDKQSLQVVVEVKNTGGSELEVAGDGISMINADGVSLKPRSIQPELPVLIQPGDSQVFSLTFPNPGGNSAVFHFLDTTLDLYY